MSKINIRCPKCDTVVSGKYGFIFNRTIECPCCKYDINPKKDAMRVVTCEHCGNSVMYDSTKARTERCPECKEPLFRHEIADVDAECPVCHTIQSVKRDEDKHICPICNTSFDVQHVISAQKVKIQAKATVVTVDSNNRNIIWKHPETSFPYASHVIVPEGYTALILYNGVCKQPSQPGSYILSDTVLSQQDKMFAAVNDPSMTLSVQIFFVKNIIDKDVNWSAPAQTVVDRNGEVQGKLGVGGKLSLRIIDSKRFAEFVGYQSATTNELLASAVNGQGSKLYEDVRSKCFNCAISVLISKVMNADISYKALEAHMNTYTLEIKSEIDHSLMEIGLQSDTFALSYVHFEEDSALTKAHATVNERIENEEKIQQYIELPFEWESPVINIHMKGDITKSADITMSGTIKFYIYNYDVFTRRSEVIGWIKNGVTESKVKDYCSLLVSNGTQTVLTDIFQPMIDDTNADIRDLSVYYRYIRQNIQDGLSNFFSKYGLDIEMFTMAEKNRKNSSGLSMMTKAAEHKTEEEIKLDVIKFDNKIKIEKAADAGQTAVKIDEIDVDVDTKITEHNQQRANNQVTRMRTSAEVQSIAEQIEYEQKKLREERSKQDYLERRKFEQQQVLDSMSFDHTLNQTTIQYKTEDNRALHYLNMEEIEAKAQELRKQWEIDSRLERDELLQQLDLKNITWNDSKAYSLEKNALSHKLKQEDALSDQVINSILRKIAESDLELKEKQDAYARLLKNSEIEDELRYLKQRADIKNDIAYTTSHIRNILTQEENLIIDEMAQKELNRQEQIQNSNFIRDMQRKEIATAHEMEILKMEYERDSEIRNLKHSSEEKEFELRHLKLLLESYENMSELDVRRFGIQEAQKTARENAEYKYKAEMERTIREMAQKRDQEQWNRENEYSKRADDLLSQMLSIQSAMNKLSLENEKISIQENASVLRTEATANAHAEALRNSKSKEESKLADLIKDLEKIAKLFEDTERNIYRDSVRNAHQNDSNSISRNSSSSYKTQNHSEYTNRGGHNTSYVNNNNDICPNCRRPVTKFAFKCPYCDTKLK